MPRYAPCATCAKPIQIGPSSRPAGESRCRDCWRSVVVHGSVKRGYRKGCRCDECRAAKAAEMREHRASRKSREGLGQPRRASRTYAPQLPCTGCGSLVSARSPEPTCRRCKRSLTLSPESRRAIYDRDGWVCGFCGYEVDRTLSGQDQFGPTLDHIVPRSLGGSDDEGNLRLVHRYCNTARSNREALTIDELVGR